MSNQTQLSIEGSHPWITYTPIKEISGGLQGVVWKCRRKRDGKLVAMKIIQVTEDDHPNRNKRYQSISTINKGIDVLNKLKAGDSAWKKYILFPEQILVNQGHISLVLSLESEDLNSYLIRNKGLIENKKYNLYFSFIHQIIGTLRYIHKIGVVHRDIKPQNLLISNDNTIKFTDWESADGNDPFTLREHSKFGSDMHVLPVRLMTLLSTGKYAWCNGYDEDCYATFIVILRMLIGNDSYLSLWREYNRGDSTLRKTATTAKQSLKNVTSVAGALMKKLKKNKKLKWFVHPLKHINHSINHMEISLGGILGKLPTQNQLISNEDDTKLEQHIVDTIIEHIPQEQIRADSACMPYYSKVVKEYCKSKLCSVTENVWGAMRSEWEKTNTYLTQKYRQEKQTNLLCKHLSPKWLSVEQIQNWNQYYNDDVETLIHKFNKLEIGSRMENKLIPRSYSATKGISYKNEKDHERYAPLGVSPKYCCKKCNAIGAHWIKNCPKNK